VRGAWIAGWAVGLGGCRGDCQILVTSEEQFRLIMNYTVVGDSVGRTCGFMCCGELRLGLDDVAWGGRLGCCLCVWGGMRVVG